MKILLTGGSGMVGKNILEHSEAQKHKIFAPTSHDLDLLDRDAVRHHIDNFEPDLVIHSAGKVGGIHANIANPVEFLTKNLDMGLNVILAAASLDVPNLINLASSCMYPREAVNPLSEDMILKGELEPTNEGYALAKIVTTRLCEYIVQEDSEKTYRTFIPCNLYGRHDKYNPKHSHLIPAVIRKIHEAKQEGKNVVNVWGDGTARREFMYAQDFAEFIFFAIDNLDKIPQNVNVGLGHDYSIIDYYKAVASVVGFDGQFEMELARPVGMRQKLVDTTVLKSLGWHHKTDLIDGIRQSYMFFKEGLGHGI
jgi:GDP-L-fucose synthase